jgi:uncharacterized protein (TIGR03435 family)
MKIAAILIVLGATLAAQQAPISFEVASIKPDQSEDRGSSSQNSSPGGRFVAINVSPKMLLIRTFGVVAAQIEGPEWLDADRYDVTAKADTSKELTPDELRPVLRKLLEDRFALRYHRETKTLPAYSLAVAKTGMKMTEHTGADGPSTTFRNQSGTLTLSARGQSTAQLTLLLGQRLDRSVIDNTGLTGEYDLSLEWAADEAADSSLPSIFTALQEQVGLRLESTKGPVEVIVIDHVERPSEN